MIRITQLKLPVDHRQEQLRKKIARTLKCGEDTFSYEIVRQSLDARHKEDKKFVYTVDVSTLAEKKMLRKNRDKNVTFFEKKEYCFPKPGEEVLKNPPVVVGSGPAGLFCAWYLARAGYRPLVLERGQEAQKRKETVDRFWKDGILDPESNVQFGEGGAGTFSDGKLNTLVKDPNGRNHEVLKRFVEAGAPQEIVYQQKPHLGTDVLIGIVETMRHQIEEMGGAFRFESKVTDLCMENGRLCAVEINDKEKIPAEVCVLALGHSARDTFSMIHRRGIFMQPKSFAVGLRIEHPQKMINMDLYGEEENEALGAASYKVTHTCENGRGVYSFCMCPGGFVVNASSEPERLTVNGMSNHDRAAKNSNSAIIASVTPEDFDGNDALAGVRFQQKWEEKAFSEGKGRIPVQTLKDFREGKITESFGEITPNTKGLTSFGNLRNCLPEPVSEAISEGMQYFDTKIKGFNREDTILCGIEARTSSPLRIERDQGFESNIKGIYPCGEGAGFAGGITSAAMDGIKVAQALVTV